jgi:hypothetical protein
VAYKSDYFDGTAAPMIKISCQNVLGEWLYQEK